MNWNELIADIDVKSRGGTANPEVADICYDSRLVKNKTVFVSIAGLKADGDAFIDDAIKRGAAAIISEKPQPQCPVPWIQCENTRKMVGILAKKLWNVSMESILSVGITGTNGKTTTAYLFREILAQHFGQQMVWMLGTVKYYLGSTTVEAHHTTPEAVDLFRFIAEADSKPHAVVMEVSSHSLELDRVGGMEFDLGVWTNLTQDHLDFHKTMEKYYEAKKKLFSCYLKSKGTAIVNIDDCWGERLVGEIGNIRCVTYGYNKKAEVRILNCSSNWNGTSIETSIDGKKHLFHSNLCGYFNAYNMLAACAGIWALGLDLNMAQKVFDQFSGVPGRFEKVPAIADFTVIIDYAHTPDAIRNVLESARRLTDGRLLCVFGCGGDRDKTKRPRMAEQAVRFSDEIFVTSDNPRTESPLEIIEDILKGVPLDFPHHVIVDRRQAIYKALTEAKKGDCVVIAGKGHETYQEINGIRHHFDDKEVVMEFFNTIKKDVVNDK